MTNHIEYLSFKGVEKKEQILFKSFLNLAKNDLSYQITVLKANASDDQTPGILILDENYVLEDDEASLADLPSIIVGNDTQKQSDFYIVRPAQWSDFKTALGKLAISGAEPAPEERVLPDADEVELEVVEDTTELVTIEDSISELDDNNLESYVSESSSIDVDSSEDIYEDYQLDNMSVDYQDLTNSEYMKVVDDVIQYNNDQEPENVDAVILVTDDESTSSNSVLVIETNSMDAWDFNELELEANAASDTTTDSFAKFKKAMGVDEVEEASELDNPTRVGNKIGLDEEYWLENNEVISNGESFLFFMPDRNMVYSDKEPGMWPPILKRSTLTKSIIADDWKPEPGMNAYPLDTFRWTHILVTDTEELHDALDDEQAYMLERWPSFELLELDNILLKLCAMLFVRPETMMSLAQKSGYGLSTVCGLMNACHEYGFLKEPDQISTGAVANDGEEGMLGKIRDVFNR